jgi:hypothetical protein
MLTQLRCLRQNHRSVLNTLTEHFEETFKIWQKHWKQFIVPEGYYFEGDSGQ